MHWEIKAFDQLSLQELYTILTLRTNVFVVEQACPYPEVDGKDPNCLHLLGTINGELVAYLRILPAGLSYDEVSIGRVVIKPSHRGKGLGPPMMEQAIPIHRFGTAYEDVSPTLAYLASELSGYVNGQCISICGGCFNPV